MEMFDVCWSVTAATNERRHSIVTAWSTDTDTMSTVTLSTIGAILMTEIS